MSKKTKTRPIEMEIKFQGVAYKCSLNEKGRVTVHSSSTAKGQTRPAGIYNTLTKEWEDNRGPIVETVRKGIEMFYDKK